MISVGFGSAIGALIRYLLTNLWKKTKVNWPVATLFINISGAFILGILTHHFLSDSQTMLFFGTGVMGGYTTFSTFNTEMVAMIDERRWAALGCYLCLSYGGGILAAWWGMQL